MYYLIETKEKSYRIVDNITDIKTKESAIYRYCLMNNITMKDSIESINLSGRYCVPTPEEANSYTVLNVTQAGWIVRGSYEYMYDLKFVHYIICDGKRKDINSNLKNKFIKMYDMKV